jgi:hypothetical protein
MTERMTARSFSNTPTAIGLGGFIAGCLDITAARFGKRT